jgi:hypothetical protein
VPAKNRKSSIRSTTFLFRINTRVMEGKSTRDGLISSKSFPPSGPWDPEIAQGPLKHFLLALQTRLGLK